MLNHETVCMYQHQVNIKTLFTCILRCIMGIRLIGRETICKLADPKHQEYESLVLAV